MNYHGLRHYTFWHMLHMFRQFLLCVMLFDQEASSFCTLYGLHSSWYHDTACQWKLSTTCSVTVSDWRVTFRLEKHVSTCEEIHAARPATSCSCRRMGIWDKCASYLIAMRASMFKTFRTASLDHATVVWRSPITSIFIGMIGQNPNIHLKPKYPRPLPSALGLWSLNDWVSQKCW